MITFANYFNITEDEELEFYNISLEKDNKLFLDPYLISIDKTSFSITATKKIQKYFSEILKIVKQQDIRKMKEISKFVKERNETFLGYSASKIRGNGFCQEDLLNIYYQILQKNIENPVIEEVIIPNTEIKESEENTVI